MSRVDDIINTAGHRLSTGEMEEYLMMHPHVAEAIVIGVNDDIKGEVPVGFVTIKSGHQVDHKQLQK
jgi:propionyl-CoA synthetase